MNFKLIIIFSIITCTFSSFVTNELSMINGNYYYSLTIGKLKYTVSLIIDTSIPFSLIASPKCKSCTAEKFDPVQGTLVLTDQKTKKEGHEFIGDLYQDIFWVDPSSQLQFEYLSFVNVTYANVVNTEGFFSLSFANQDLLKVKAIGLDLSDSSGSIDIGDINTEYFENKTLLKTYPVSISEDKLHWFMNVESFTIGTNKFTTPIQFNYDSTIWVMSIPKKFFFENIETIFPIESRCQVRTTGYFICECSSTDYQTAFPNYTFWINGTDYHIETKDYVQLDTGGNICYVYISINYESDYWVGGLNAINNHYMVFDYENKKILTYPRTITSKKKMDFLVIFFIILALSSFVLYGGYYLYRRCIAQRRNNNEEEEAEGAVDIHEDQG